MLTWKRILLVSGIILVLALLFLSLALPGVIADKAKVWVAQETGRVLEIGEISLNPINLSLEIHQLSLSEVDQATPFVSWDRLRIALSPKSLYYRAPILREIRLDRPYVHLERQTTERFNFSDLIPESTGEPTAPDGSEPARFSVNNLVVSDGRIELFDLSLAEPTRHTIDELNLALPAIGNLPFMVENPVQPHLQALINDAPIDIKGELKPFSDTQEMRVSLAFDNIDLPFYLGYVPTELPVELRNGRLGFELDVVYRTRPEAGAELEMSGQVNLAALDIRDRQQERLFFLPLLQAEIAPSQPLAQDIHLSSLRIYNLEVQLQRDRQGVWNHSRLKTSEASPAEPETAPEKSPSPLKLQVDAIEIRDGVVVFKDDYPAKPFETTARDINIDLNAFRLDATEPSPLKLALETDHDETVSVDGAFLLSPLTLNLHAAVNDLLMSAYEPYYGDTYAGPLGGRMSLAADLAITPEHSFRVENGMLAWHDAYMAFDEQDGLGIDLVEISGLGFDLDQSRLEIGYARYHDGRVKFSRHADGHWSFFSQNFPILAKLTEPTDASEPAPAAEEGTPFSYQIGELSLGDWQFDVVDQKPATPVRLQAREFNLSLRNLAAPTKVSSPVEFSTRFQNKGRIHITGTVSVADQSARLKTRLSQIALTTIAPYVAEQTNLVLNDGDLFANLAISLMPDNGAMQVRYGGDIGVTRLSLLDGLHREDLLKWGSLQVAGISGQTVPMKLAIESITLSDYFAKVLVDEHARLNLVEAFRKEVGAEEPAGSDPEGTTPIPAEPEAETAAESTPEIRINTVTLQGGHVDFTDRNLPQPFHADMRDLGGRIQGLSSTPDELAKVDLRGHLRNQSPLEISGVINPLAKDLFLDLELSFRDIELSPMSPYSGTYVGYLIKKGKLNLALDYLIEDHQLTASNKVFLDQFTFGEAVESDKATGLPVKLAVALLKDRRGEIHLDIPVAGSLDDPEFNIGGVIWTVLKNLLVKAATSPMALLGALVGGGDEDFSSITFPYGSIRLPQPEQEKLLHMAEALRDRPALDVEVKGFIDPENDPEGYRREQLRLQVQRAKYLELVEKQSLPEGQTAENVEVTAEEYPDYLWAVYKDAPFPKPRNFIGITKKLPPPEMEKLIYTNTDVGASELADIAQQRALTVQNYLIEQGQLPRERIFLTKPDIEALPAREDASRSRVEFGITVR